MGRKLASNFTPGCSKIGWMPPNPHFVDKKRPHLRSSVVSPCCLASCSSFNTLLVLFCNPTRVDPQKPHRNRFRDLGTTERSQKDRNASPQAPDGWTDSHQAKWPSGNVAVDGCDLLLGTTK